MGIHQHLCKWIGKLYSWLEGSIIAGERSELFRLKVTDLHRKRWGDSWHRVGVIVTNAAGEFLLVEDLRCRINGVWQTVEDHWNIPSGSCEEDERLLDAALREAHEELGWGVVLKGICAIKHGSHHDDPSLLVVFVAELTDEVFEVDPKEIKSQRSFSARAIQKLAEQNRLRSPDLVLQAVRNYQAGLIVPLEILNEYHP